MSEMNIVHIAPDEDRVERAAAAEEPIATVRLADYAPPSFVVDSVDLTFDLDPEVTVVTSLMRVRRAVGAAADAALRLDGRALTLRSLRLDGEPISDNRLRHDDEGLTLLDPPDVFQLEIETEIRPRDNKSRAGLMDIGGQLVTQCEPEGFRRLTYFPDRPDVLATYSVTLRADRDRYPVLLSNGDVAARGEGPGGRHWATWKDPFRKPSYLFAIVAGRFERVSRTHVTRSGRAVEINVWADPDLVAHCEFALASAQRALAWDEQAYGLEYDLDQYNIVAVTGWSGAMENKGLNLFGAAGVVADPEIATDDDFIIIERIIGHEAFHNWTGNRVTCRDWFQLCLKEGLTRFRDQHFIEDKLGAGVWRIESVKALRRNQFPEDDGPAAHPVQPTAYAEIDNFYTNTVYDKGAEIVRMLRTLLGPSGFRAGFDLYIARNDGQAVTMEAFVTAMEDASGRDLAQFRRWWSQAGRPRVKAAGAYAAASRSYRLTLSQTCRPTPGQPQKAPFHIPVALGLVSEDGRALEFRAPAASRAAASAVLELTEAEQTFVLEEVASPPLPSLLRGFSAPVTLESEATDAMLARLSASDSDPFARWDAAQRVSIGLIRAMAEERAGGRPMSVPQLFLDAVDATLAKALDETLLSAFVLAVPDEPVLSGELARVDLDGLMAGRLRLRQAVSSAFKARLLGLYEALKEMGPYQPDVAGIGRRRLKSVVLDFLVAEGSREMAQLCLDQLTAPGNMTDRFDALAQLAHFDQPERQVGFDWFYDRFRQHPTVVDKWFNAQALSRAPGAVDRIIALEHHPAFDIENHSQALAYYGGFFRQNRVAFHDPSGRGYEFLADRLLTIDSMGRTGSHYLMPQINQWRRYDDHRQGLMRAALERVAGTAGISRGLQETVAKALS